MFTKAIPIIILFISCNAYHPNILHPQANALIKLTNYDSSTRPPGGKDVGTESEPVRVDINLFVRSIENIKQVENEYTVQITFRAVWVDPRLRYDEENPESSVSTNDVQTFWKPDIFFSNEKSGYLHSVAVPNSFVRIYPDGKIMMSSRYTLLLHCAMQLRYFPFDKQECQLRLASYGYTESDVVLSWKTEDPIQMANIYHIPGYTLTDFGHEDCTSVTSTGTYSCLRVNFHFSRNGWVYVIRLYLPLLLLAAASWTSFWLSPTAVLQRLSIGAVTSLTTALLLSRDDDFMRLPTITSLDIWVGVTAFFIFAAFFEFILVTYLDSRRRTVEVQEQGEDVEQGTKSKKVFWITIPQDKSVADVISKVAFPTLFTVIHLLIAVIEA